MVDLPTVDASVVSFTNISSEAAAGAISRELKTTALFSPPSRGLQVTMSSMKLLEAIVMCVWEGGLRIGVTIP